MTRSEWHQLRAKLLGQLRHLLTQPIDDELRKLAEETVQLLEEAV